jgi:hypothetical protein
LNCWLLTWTRHKLQYRKKYFKFGKILLSGRIVHSLKIIKSVNFELRFKNFLYLLQWSNVIVSFFKSSKFYINSIILTDNPQTCEINKNIQIIFHFPKNNNQMKLAKFNKKKLSRIQFTMWVLVKKQFLWNSLANLFEKRFK